MPQVCQPRSSRSNSATSNSKHRRSSSCWRNPCVVFWITFGILFTLRFRTPTRQAAVKLLNKKHQQQGSLKKSNNSSNNNQQQQQTAENSPATSTANLIESATNEIMAKTKLKTKIFYKRTEEGKHANGASFVKYQALDAAGKPLSFHQWARHMADASAVEASGSTTHAADSLTKLIQDAPFKAVFFETPPVNAETCLTKSFEFVLVDAPDLADFADESPNSQAFAAQFQACQQDALSCAFDNLGKDALLVVPKPLNDASSYGHLAKFVRHAPANQVRSLWSLAASSMLQRWTIKASQPVWWSTSGTGVAWLHFRLDDRPKYYTHQLYKVFDEPKSAVTTMSAQSDI
ncbi:hypothetical protein MPSEU_000992300 [Mayamaea pseudoterrestris]|nr:hypothetical protein MPSEU_000992300 [Mayamaea pseudoterrestris]